MNLTFIGAAHEVTGSCHCLQVCGKTILVDYGMEQGANVFENAELPVEPAFVDYVLLTHAHVDHSGMLPKLYARGFRGQIFMTDATADLCSIMLRDCAHIQMQEAEWKNRKAKRSAEVQAVEPVYTMEDADGTIKQIVPCHYNTIVNLCEGIKIRFTDIGHLLGSSSIEVWMHENGVEKKIVFSGDIGNINQPLIKDPQKTPDADYVVVESTYGDRLHTKERPDYVADLTAILQETFDKGGNVVIPSFAVGRTQELLYFLRQIKNDRLVKGHEDFPVYVDSPLAVEATGIFQKNVYNCFDEEAKELVRKGVNIIGFQGHNLWRPECTILFVGYQAAGTLGRHIVEGASDVKLFGEPIEIRASIKKLIGLSGHADKNGLIDWLSGFEKKPERVFVVHGEESVCEAFKDCLNNEYGYHAYAPYSGTRFNLASNEVEYAAVPVRVEKKKTKGASEVFRRLLAAGQRLLAVIQHNEGGTNKDLAKFADQINSLCDKWDRQKPKGMKQGQGMEKTK